jgi:hypothetical protein
MNTSRALRSSVVVLIALAAAVAASCGSDDPAEPAAAGGGGGGGSGDAGPDHEAASDAVSEVGPACSTSDPGAETRECASPAAATTTDAAYAITYVYADEDRTRTKDPSNVWRYVGFDLDGQSTDAASTDHCRPLAGADADLVKTDGDGGIDNAFLKSIAPIIAGVDSDWVDSWNRSLAKGSASIVLRLPGLVLPAAGQAGTPGDGSTSAGMGYTSVKRCEADGGTGGAGGAGNTGDAGQDPPPIVAIDRTSVCDGDLGAPLWSAPEGSLTGDVWVSGEIPEGWLAIPFNSATLVVRLRRVRVEMTLSADRRHVTFGTIAGVADTEELISQLTLIRGAISPLACSVLFDSYIQRIRRSSDIMADGTQDPAAECTGISLGLGFDAELVRLGDVVSTPPVADTCG